MAFQTGNTTVFRLTGHYRLVMGTSFAPILTLRTGGGGAAVSYTGGGSGGVKRVTLWRDGGPSREFTSAVGAGVLFDGSFDITIPVMEIAELSDQWLLMWVGQPEANAVFKCDGHTLTDKLPTGWLVSPGGFVRYNAFGGATWNGVQVEVSAAMSGTLSESWNRPVTFNDTGGPVAMTREFSGGQLRIQSEAGATFIHYGNGSLGDVGLLQPALTVRMEGRLTRIGGLPYDGTLPVEVRADGWLKDMIAGGEDFRALDVVGALDAQSLPPSAAFVEVEAVVPEEGFPLLREEGWLPGIGARGNFDLPLRLALSAPEAGREWTPLTVEVAAAKPLTFANSKHIFADASGWTTTGSKESDGETLTLTGAAQATASVPWRLFHRYLELDILAEVVGTLTLEFVNAGSVTGRFPLKLETPGQWETLRLDLLVWARESMNRPAPMTIEQLRLTGLATSRTYQFKNLKAIVADGAVAYSLPGSGRVEVLSDHLPVVTLTAPGLDTLSEMAQRSNPRCGLTVSFTPQGADLGISVGTYPATAPVNANTATRHLKEGVFSLSGPTPLPVKLNGVSVLAQGGDLRPVCVHSLGGYLAGWTVSSGKQAVAEVGVAFDRLRTDDTGSEAAQRLAPEGETTSGPDGWWIFPGVRSTGPEYVFLDNRFQGGYPWSNRLESWLTQHPEALTQQIISDHRFTWWMPLSTPEAGKIRSVTGPGHVTSIAHKTDEGVALTRTFDGGRALQTAVAVADPEAKVGGVWQSSDGRVGLLTLEDERALQRTTWNAYAPEPTWSEPVEVFLPPIVNWDAIEFAGLLLWVALRPAGDGLYQFVGRRSGDGGQTFLNNEDEYLLDWEGGSLVSRLEFTLTVEPSGTILLFYYGANGQLATLRSRGLGGPNTWEAL